MPLKFLRHWEIKKSNKFCFLYGSNSFPVSKGHQLPWEPLWFSSVAPCICLDRPVIRTLPHPSHLIQNRPLIRRCRSSTPSSKIQVNKHVRKTRVGKVKTPSQTSSSLARAEDWRRVLYIGKLAACAINGDSVTVLAQYCRSNEVYPPFV
jgi:hypothetical protein